MKYFIFSIFLFLSVACSVKTIRYETDKYARIVDPQGANIYYSSDLKKSIKHLSSGTLLKVSRETTDKYSYLDYGNGRIYRIEARSGIQGWVFGKFIDFISFEDFEKYNESEIDQYELYLKRVVLDTVKTYCETKLHQFSKITAMSVDTIIAIPFSQSCQIDISSIMTVRFFALQKYSVRLSIYCDVKDIDNLSAAGANIKSISVNYDDILDNDKTVKQHTAKQRSSSDDNANKEISNVLIDWGLDMIPGLGMFKGVIKKMLKSR